ncbi:MAG: adenylate/guanylate cyclase domain-containing protein [Glaciimonas sp.]|nr:adenylate/guanylate cyclase domain-containing protein [Glaciimonas sp.]
MIRSLLLALALVGAVLVPLLRPGWLQPLALVLDDWRVRLTVTPFPESRIVIVDIDEHSLSALGAWPWPRDSLARMLRILLDDYQVAAVAMDMVMPEVRSGEAALAAQLQRPQVTAAVVFDPANRGLPPLAADNPVLALALAAAPPLSATPDAPAMTAVPVMANHAGLAATRAGHITPIFDDDRRVRRLSPLLCIPGGQCLPTLALASYAGLLEQPTLALQPGRGWLGPNWQLQLLSDGIPTATLPLDANGALAVPYRHAEQDWLAISAADILRHAVDPALLKNVVVLVGSSALGLSDVISTPLKAGSAGFVPHAEIFSALLDDDFRYMPRNGWWLTTLLLLPFGLALGWLSGHYGQSARRILVFPLWLGLSWGLCGAVALLTARYANLLLPLMPLFLFAPLALLLLLPAELYHAAHAHQGMMHLLQAYLPKSVASRLALRGRVGNSTDASRRLITVMFADVHGFSGLCEVRSPELVAQLMQRVFSEMAEAVAAQHGTIDKFIGDAIMAFWNAPEDDAQHAPHALAAAQDILQRIAALDGFCMKLGFAPLQVGIGLETGVALVGNFGTRHRDTFTAMGEPVVLASRLQGLTGTFGVPLLVGQTCAGSADMPPLHPLGLTAIRGRQQRLAVFTLPERPVLTLESTPSSNTGAQ